MDEILREADLLDFYRRADKTLKLLEETRELQGVFNVEINQLLKLLGKEREPGTTLISGFKQLYTEVEKLVRERAELLNKLGIAHE